MKDETEAIRRDEMLKTDILVVQIYDLIPMDIKELIMGQELGSAMWHPEAITEHNIRLWADANKMFVVGKYLLQVSMNMGSPVPLVGPSGPLLWQHGKPNTDLPEVSAGDQGPTITLGNKEKMN